MSKPKGESLKRALRAASQADKPAPIVREPEFSKRLDQACDAAGVPPKNRGRLTWIQRELHARAGELVSVETVRKWFAGEAKPRPDKLSHIANLLGVELVWLSLGVQSDLSPRDRKARNAMADGAVNLLAGLIQMDGGHVAFPSDTDDGAKASEVDLHAIIRGAKYDIHVCTSDSAKGAFTFDVPNAYERLVVLGVIRHGFRAEIFEITPELTDSVGQRRGPSIKVHVQATDGRLRKITSFENRL